MKQSRDFEIISFYLVWQKGEIQKVLLLETSFPLEMKAAIKFQRSFINLQTIQALIIHNLSKLQIQKYQEF